MLFDAIEFNDAFACIDVWYDVAFLIMDLLGRSLARAASIVFNHYLLRTSDVGGLRLLPLFLATRAAVRAKTSLAAAALENDDRRVRELQGRARDYVGLAERCLANRTARLIAIGGRSGSGKSTLAARLAPEFGPLPGAVVLRSDVLRKVLLHHAPTDRLGSDAYTAGVTEAVYRALAVRAGDILIGGGTVIVDATFLSPVSRADIAAVAARVGVPFTGLWLEAPVAEMAARLQARVGDASDANVGVLESQLARDIGEIDWQRLDTSGDVSRAAEAVRARLDSIG
jgi:predicted kinase